MSKHRYQQCNRCVMDTSASNILFDKDGICNYCTDFKNNQLKLIQQDSAGLTKKLNYLVSRIKECGKKKEYDCVVGVSGGVDSSWTLVKAMEFGLRPLPVHMDNGWNSELAQSNINNLVNKLGLDLYTYVIDWNEYRAMMEAFFQADVIDVELLYDNAMLGVNYRLASKHNIKYILFGTNMSTEGIQIPGNWNWLKNDARNIRAICRKYGAKISSFPTFGSLELVWQKIARGIANHSLLDHLDYNKEYAVEHLKKKYGYISYPYKHYESVFTRFYQGYILPEKFGIDKRRVHLSTLIMTNQISRESSLEDLKKIPYPSQSDLDKDITFFLKKMNWSSDDLENYLARPEVAHDRYGSELKLFERLLYFRDLFSVK